MSTGTSPRAFPDVRHHRDPQRPRRPRGRWIWTLSGLIVLLLFAIPITTAIVKAGRPGGGSGQRPDIHVVTIASPVTSVGVQSYGSDIHVIGGGTSRVQVTETVFYDRGAGPAPRVADTVSGGHLTLAAPACAEMDCSVGYTVRVPAAVSVTATASGGNIVVSGVAGANLDSGGGDVTATSVSGALTVTSQGGNEYLTRIGGALAAESGGGDMVIQGLTAPAATMTTDGGNLIAMGMAVPSETLSSGGGDARIGFATTPGSMLVTTNGGNAIVQVPGGPFALTADSGGGPEVVGIATSPAARASLNVSTDGGSLIVEPAAVGSALRVGPVPSRRDLPGVPRAPRAPRAPVAPRSAA